MMSSNFAQSFKAGRTSRAVAANIFTKKKSSNNTKTVVNQDAGVPATQFNVRVGKDQVVPITLGFTKSNELFVGRAAMVGFAAAVIGEIITGKGALAQFNLETGIPITDIDGVVAFIAIFNLIAALLPAKGKLILPEDELADDRRGPLQDPKVSILEPKKFFGFSGFGFTKENEIFVGRLAQLGFAFALIGESITGKGPLGQLGIETGIPLNEAEPLLLASIIFTLFAAINEGRGRFVDEQAHATACAIKRHIDAS
eukprot:TRINITY_DN1140_c0_g1_i1.p1 TRINITY_DN1140_c0_g1~~TRINITY_DN1140_c0_g1_i1.p1  ORF type:complete len:256 (+),score=40.65 TRINITY_DN1140_c0_g1_i1:891-1658(+)